MADTDVIVGGGLATATEIADVCKKMSSTSFDVVIGPAAV